MSYSDLMVSPVESTDHRTWKVVARIVLSDKAKDYYTKQHLYGFPVAAHKSVIYTLISFVNEGVVFESTEFDDVHEFLVAVSKGHTELERKFYLLSEYL